MYALALVSCLWILCWQRGWQHWEGCREECDQVFAFSRHSQLPRLAGLCLCHLGKSMLVAIWVIRSNYLLTSELILGVVGRLGVVEGNGRLGCAGWVGRVGRVGWVGREMVEDGELKPEEISIEEKSSETSLLFPSFSLVLLYYIIGSFCFW